MSIFLQFEPSDCSIVLCYPQEDVFKAGDQDVTLETGALVEPSTGSMVMSAGGKVTMTLKPVITGERTEWAEIVSEQASDNL